MPVKSTKKTRPVGRPTLYTPELAEKICDLIRKGKSERKICAMKGMPSIRTLVYWKEQNPEFLQQSVRAREESAELYAELATDEAVSLGKNAEALVKGKLIGFGDLPIADFPKGYVEAKKILIQQLNREAAIRDDSRYGDRKTVAVTTNEEAGSGMADVYARMKAAQEDSDGD